VTKQNFGYLMHLVGYLYEDYHEARSLEHKVYAIYLIISFCNFMFPLKDKVRLTIAWPESELENLNIMNFHSDIEK
jgi:hypothetical protein